MRRKGGFVAIFIGDSTLPVAGSSVLCREDREISKGVDAFAHAQYGIRVHSDNCAQIAVGNGK